MERLKSFFAIIGWLTVGFYTLAIVGAIAGLVAIIRGSDMDTEMGKPKTENAIGVVELMGEITTSEKFSKSLRKAMDDKDIKGVIVRIDSPGGAVGASEEIYEAIRVASTKEGAKPIVCSLGNMAASGGLYASMGCPKVVTNRGTLSGSIGVIMMSPNVSGIMQNFGVQMNIVKSGKYKDTGSPFREQTPDDKAFLQGLIDTAYGQFVDIISKSRNIPVETVKTFADGRIILGETAVKLGLADEVGGIERAAKIVAEQAKLVGETELVYSGKQTGLLSYFKDSAVSLPLVKYLFGELGPELRFQLM